MKYVLTGSDGRSGGQNGWIWKRTILLLVGSDVRKREQHRSRLASSTRHAQTGPVFVDVEPSATRDASRRQNREPTAGRVEGHHQGQLGVPTEAIPDALEDLLAA